MMRVIPSALDPFRRFLHENSENKSRFYISTGTNTCLSSRVLGL